MQTRDAMHVEAHARDVCAPTTAPRREAVAARALVFQPLLADVFALSMQTKHVHWSMCGRHVRAYHLLLAEQGAPLFVMTDAPAERACAIGGATLSSISAIARHQHGQDNTDANVTPQAMVAARSTDNQQQPRCLPATQRPTPVRDAPRGRC